MAEPAQHPWTGYTLYRVFHKKQKRWYAQLVSPGHRTTRQLARYLMDVHLGRRLDRAETVDHINEDALDDRLDNLQILTQTENSRKSSTTGRTMIELECPTCRTRFERERRQTHLVKGGDRTFCSRTCRARFPGRTSA